MHLFKLINVATAFHAAIIRTIAKLLRGQIDLRPADKEPAVIDLETQIAAGLKELEEMLHE